MSASMIGRRHWVSVDAPGTPIWQRPDACLGPTLFSGDVSGQSRRVCGLLTVLADVCPVCDLSWVGTLSSGGFVRIPAVVFVFDQTKLS